MKAKNFSKFIKTHKYQTLLAVILLFSALPRFYGFQHLWGLGDDDGREVLIAKEALSRRELPLTGSFSSAGPFVFGPIFYWLIMASYILLPFAINAPWIVGGITSILTILVLAYSAKLIGGEKLAIITALLAATSPQLINRSTTLSQHTFVIILTSLLVLSFILLWQKKKLIYALFMGLSLGTALSMHYQALNLFIFFPVILFIPNLSFRKKLLGIFIMFFGFIIPSLPLIIWDSRQDWANTRNILDYFLIGQYRIYVPNSWKLFIFNYFPNYWAYVTGGNLLFGFIIMATTIILLIFSVLKKKIPLILITLAVIFAIFAFVNRYYQGERSEGYMLYFVPFIILFSAWTFEKLFNLQDFLKFKNKPPELVFTSLKILAIIFLLIVFSANLSTSQTHWNYSNKVDKMQKIADFIIEKYPNQKISIYDLNWKTSNLSYPLSIFLSEKGKTDKNGIAIGVMYKGLLSPYPKEVKLPVITTFSGYQIVDLREINVATQSMWVNVNRESVYDDLITRWQKNKLTSSFSLKKYLLEKIGK